MRLWPIVIKYAIGLILGQSIIEIIEDPHKDNFNNFVVDLSNNIKERFFTSLSDDETNVVINLGYLSISWTILFSLPRLS